MYTKFCCLLLSAFLTMTTNSYNHKEDKNVNTSEITEVSQSTQVTKVTENPKPTNNTQKIEEQEDIYNKGNKVNADIFKKLKKGEQKAIKEIIDNLEQYDEKGILAQNIDKNDFVVFNNGPFVVIEIGKEENKVILSLWKDDEVENNYIFQNVFLAKDSITSHLPTFEKIDFLDSEQKLLLENAIELYSASKNVGSKLCDYERVKDNENAKIYIEIENRYGDINESPFLLCENDKFTDYQGFINYVDSIFTKELCESIKNNDRQFIEQGGKLYCSCVARNGNIAYMGEETNKFELISKSDNKIELNLLAHYRNIIECEGNKPEWVEVVRKKAVLEKIDGIWKVSQLVLPW